MTEQPTRRQRGQDKIAEVYAGDIADIPEGLIPFQDVMLETVFAGVWDRDVLSVRDRRLLIMGVIAAAGQSEVYRIQARAALRNGELDPDQLRETLIMLAPYAGYPNVAGIVTVVEEVIAEVTAEAGT